LEFALILKHVKFPVNFYFSLDLNYSEDLELIAEIFSKKWGEGGKGAEETMFKKWTFPYRPDGE
jgi:hypothetical protein